MCNEGQHAMFRVDQFHTEEDREFLHLVTSSAEEILSEFCAVLVLCSLLCQGISGNHSSNCLPLATWISTGHQSVKFQKMADVVKNNSTVEAVAICADAETIKAYTWPNRGNFYYPQSSCYKCDLR